MDAPRPVPEDLETRFRLLGDRCARVPGLIAAVLYGSAARGTMTPWSDVDIAVLGSRDLPVELRLDLLADATRILGRDVDLVDLRRAALPLRGHAVHDARPLVVTDAEAWDDFVTETTVAWLDYKPGYERAIADELERLRGTVSA